MGTVLHIIANSYRKKVKQDYIIDVQITAGIMKTNGHVGYAACG